MINKKWQLLYPKEISRKNRPEEIIRILLKNRKIVPKERADFINPVSPQKIQPRTAGISKVSLKKAMAVIKKNKEKKIVIYGDYDADGLCATAIVWEALWQKGYQVIPFIPDREKDSYGINPQSVKRLVAENPDLGLIITVDNGIVAFEGVKFAQSLGIKIIITDHHVALPKLPQAEVIIHSPALAGSGVAWFLASCFGYRPLDLVALGTISDMLPLLGVNRSFVKHGLRDLAYTKRSGLRALKKKSGIDQVKEISPWQVSFLLAPRLNAAGRLAEAIDGLRLLCTKDCLRATKLVDKLEGFNSERQKLTIDGLEDAKAKIGQPSEKIIFAIDPSYRQGVIGLIAGKLVEEFNRPSIVIAKGRKISKGSARSTNGCNIIELVRTADRFLIDAGGHPMAAGFTIETDKIPQFVEQVKRSAKRKIKAECLIPQIKVDFALSLSLISNKFYQLINKLAPFGFGNPEPLFLINSARVIRSQALGSNKQHLKLWLDDSKTKITERVVAEAIGFGWGDFWQETISGDLVDLVASLTLNRWRGQETLQLKIHDLRKSVEMLK